LKINTNQTFADKTSLDPFKNAENPLLRSGLIFAGGNHAWNNQPLPAGVEDGILLASEVSEMYLPNTQLVVLSACETGLGDIKGAEGVFGLQRAFKMAGVKYLIISLWQVPDYQTSELMSKFYENWLAGLPIHNSFRNAQAFLKQKYPGDPFNWAAFVMVE
jgi:CHAT domain-containing protein